MKPSLVHLLPIVMVALQWAHGAGVPAPAVLPGKGLAEHDFFYAGEAKEERMFIVRKGQIVWSYTHPGKGEISDAILLPNGNVLFAHQYGITEVTADKKVVWNLDAPPNTEIHTAQPLGPDSVWYVQNGDPAKFIVINRTTGKTEREFVLPVKNPKSIHGQFRHARMTDAGNILVAHMDLGKAVEYNLDGKEVWSADVPGVWSATPLKNGNILVVSTRKFVRELNRQGQTVWEWTPADTPEYKFSNLQLAVRLPNGNTIINDWFNQWSGRLDTNNPPIQAIEVTPDKKVVWALRSWAPPADLGPATTIQILDESGARSAAAADAPGQTAGRLAPRPLYRDPPFDAPTDPVLCFNAEAGKWYMYYTARRAAATNAPGVSWVHGSNIGIAESSDAGATWTYNGTADISYGKDQHPNDYTYWAPEVVWAGDTYHMFLSYVPGIFNDWNHPREIVHLTSKDGIKWDTIGKVDLKSERTIDACVMQVPGGGWRMWYKDERAKRSLCYADSPDLVHWEPKGNCVTNFNGEGPKAFHWKGKYWLIADCWQNGMRVWHSDDCLNWTMQDKTLPGSHGDAVVSGGRAWWFYFTERGRRAAIDVLELFVTDGKLVPGDPVQPIYIDLKPEREQED